MVSLGFLKISLPRFATVLLFFTAGLLSLVLRARRLLGAYRIPWRPPFSSHLVSQGVEAVSMADDARPKAPRRAPRAIRPRVQRGLGMIADGTWQSKTKSLWAFSKQR